MALKISIGQYYPVDSNVHRLDPRVKLGSALLVMLLTFFIQTPAQLLFALAFAFCVTVAARIPASKVAASLRSLVAVLAFLAIFNLLLVGGETVLWSWGPLSITTKSIWAAILYSLRVVIAVLMGALMLLTTTPTQLTDAFDAGLAPLSKLGLPGHELAMVFSLMLRFIPTLSDELTAILDAQKSRGGSLGEGSLAKRVHAVVPVLVALLASSIHHANGLSRALDARCYAPGAPRTHMKPLHMASRDWSALFLVGMYAAVLLMLGTLG